MGHWTQDPAYREALRISNSEHESADRRALARAEIMRIQADYFGGVSK
ncbi:hypothetical protein SEA_GOIB_48 [Gordonia phage Goib]|uniref:Uncharacterized protein n=2 Tax=Vendettavirus vendetta TaxID=2049886 RepID=A0A160DFI6_9CAUD|nr:hypothetical protein BH795_gp64 [Gordonia phage Vendetta]YP_009275401.1 hypothetical protein BH760_gp64 [Gordonia phage Splinter]ANA85594.1 hypothetical protein PBI_VENDETTA_47 [Gordonia phage Vendetta]ANA85673.1 hypothetical protein PBI_SPLINTER_47 [Gordonia phage Splinter]WNO25790.1 hypothetical protein SEA_GOIB_48 [Gordonia phage Goib]